ncbi:MAG: Lipid flippase MurJ [Gaiellaceae bacterium]|nr:Lipid flippase MurJ [Gaiellaceae bacterium]MDX6472157.1 Lipid flippase MurJ [Gaiellaceae bacterium]
MSIWRRRSALRSGLLTGLAQIVVALAAAGAGALLAHKFGRGVETDGFLAAYAVYLVLVLAAQAFRMVVVPDLTRAESEGRLGGETRAYAITILSLAVPASAIAIALSGSIGRLLTGSLPPHAAHVAARALVVLVPAAFGQLLAALAASALAARDSYGTAAAGFALGGIAGLVVFASLAGSQGIVALAWGLAANAAIAILVPVAALARRHALGGAAPDRLELGRRMWNLLQGASVPLALQGCYLLVLRFAAQLGVGRVTSLSYAYLAASTLVGATAFSLGLISSAPLTRRGIDAVAAGRHVVHAAWVSLSLVGAAAGVFALVGGRIVGVVLGSAYAGGVGRELGHLVVYLALWMLAWVGFAVAFPLVFVAEKRWTLVPLAALGFLLCIPIGLGLRSLWGLPGLAIALGVSTFVIAAGLIATLSLQTLAIAAQGLAKLALAVGASAALAFGALSLLLSPVPAAVVGVLVYGLLVFALRSLGLSEAWVYVRSLH